MYPYPVINGRVWVKLIKWFYLTPLVESNRESLQNKIPILLNVEDDPKTFNGSMSSRDASFFREVINDEWTHYCLTILGF